MLKLIGLFIKIDENLILFNSFGGKRFDDSPKEIYNVMKKDSRFKNYKLIWSFQEPEKLNLPADVNYIKADTLKYFIIALKARVWVTNSSMERGLDFKRKNTFCLNTWHGTAIKIMGNDLQPDNRSFRSKVNVRADIMLAQSQYDVYIFSKAFSITKENIYITGLPRNDILANYSEEFVTEIKKKLNIPLRKKVLLYAPTFREYTQGKHNEIILDIPIDIKKWQKKLCDNYIILFRAHYEVAKCMNLDNYDGFIDVSEYPCLNELMIVSDALISDYSSIFFDYSIMHKPMYCFAYDYDEYVSNRGMYIDLKQELPCKINYDEESLLADILDFENSKKNNIEKSRIFQKKYVSTYGNAAIKCCEIINSII